MKVIDRTKAVTRHFLEKIILEFINKKEKKKPKNTKSSVCSKCLLRLDVLHVFVLFCVLVFV